MMVGKADGTSASFVNYQLYSKDGKNDAETSNVSEAVRGKTIAERSQEPTDAAQRSIFGTDAYKVDIIDRAKNWLTFVSGSTAQISSPIGAGWTREDELGALEKTLGRFQSMNENYNLTGSPADPEAERRRMEAITSGFEPGNFVDVNANAAESGIYVAQQDFSQTLKTPTGVENNTPNATYTPVTEIRSQHYRWTEESGIEETVSKEEEIAAARSQLRYDLEDTITRSIEKILTPYDTYEEAYDALYGRQGVAVWSSLDEDGMSRVDKLKPVQGEFGALANYLNNYMEEFGTDDSLFSTLENTLSGLLDDHGENDIVNQIRRMIATSRSGKAIDATSEQFEKEVKDATVGTYGGPEEQESGDKEKKTEDSAKEQKQGLTFLDMQRRAAEEEGQLLDELLGKEHERNIESAGDVLKKRAPEGKDMEFTEKLRHVDEKKDPPEPFAFAVEKGSSTEMPRDGVVRLKAIHDAWLSTSEELIEGFKAEKQEYYEKALDAAKAGGVDILA